MGRMDSLTVKDLYGTNDIVRMTKHVAFKRGLHNYEDVWDIVNAVFMYNDIWDCPANLVYVHIGQTMSRYRKVTMGTYTDDKYKVYNPIPLSSLEPKESKRQASREDAYVDTIHFSLNNDIDEVDFVDFIESITEGRKETLVMKLRYIACLDWSEIAKTLGCSDGTPYYIHNRIINRTREEKGVAGLTELPANSNEKSKWKQGKSRAGRYTIVRKAHKCSRKLLGKKVA